MPLLKKRLLVRVDTFGGYFDFADPAEGKKQLYEILGWFLGGLLHDVADRVSNCGLEHHTTSLQARQVHSHELSRFQHRST